MPIEGCRDGDSLVSLNHDDKVIVGLDVVMALIELALYFLGAHDQARNFLIPVLLAWLLVGVRIWRSGT